MTLSECLVGQAGSDAQSLLLLRYLNDIETNTGHRRLARAVQQVLC